MRQIDLYDIAMVAGIGLLSVGLWLVNPTLYLIVAGVGLISATVLHALSRKG